MIGYDTLLSSYYDHYILEYELFKPWKFDYATFQIPTGMETKKLYIVAQTP